MQIMRASWSNHDHARETRRLELPRFSSLLAPPHSRGSWLLPAEAEHGSILARRRRQLDVLAVGPPLGRLAEAGEDLGARRCGRGLSDCRRRLVGAWYHAAWCAVLVVLVLLVLHPLG